MRSINDSLILGAMRCPVCKQEMSLREGGCVSLVCGGARTHCFDLASSGYVNLSSPTKSGGGDSKHAVRARSRFLDLDLYRPVADEIARVCSQYKSQGGLLIDAGCGEGYYSVIMAKNGFSVFGADLSKFAVDAASKRAGREGADNAFFATASVYELPVADSSAQVVTNIFAPCVESEFSRVLAPDGILVVAWAGENHLNGLKNAIYEKTHLNAERADLPEKMQEIDRRRVTREITLCSNEQIMDLFAMTPYYWRTSVSDGEKLSRLDSLKTEVDIMITVYKNNK